MIGFKSNCKRISLLNTKINEKRIKTNATDGKYQRKKTSESNPFDPLFHSLPLEIEKKM